jgi:hypothetical protein
MQWRLSSLFAWTTIVALLLAAMRTLPWEAAPIFAALFAPPLLGLPMLLDRYLQRRDEGLRFRPLERFWLQFGLAGYSIVMLSLATFAFAPDWKGHKGPHPFYYFLDYPAGLTLLPIYALGVFSFSRSVGDTTYRERSWLNLTLIITCSLISFWYTFAALFMRFADNQQNFAIVPGSVSVGYALYARNVLTYGKLRETPIDAAGWRWIVAWLTAVSAAIVAKIPLASRLYADLPDELPEGCFIVSAATRGHPRVVGAWHEATLDRVVNRQLLEFWAFEAKLQKRYPRFHRQLRRIYNCIAPSIARGVRFRWQADILYWTLKPMQWLISW